MRGTMPVTGVRETVAALKRVEVLTRAEARRAVAASVARVHAQARARCPVGSGTQRSYPTAGVSEDVLRSLQVGPFRGHVRDQIKTQMHQTEPSGAVFVERRGLQGKYGTDNVAIWLEYGTVKMAARPFMGPAAEAERPRFLADLTDAVSRAVEAV